MTTQETIIASVSDKLDRVVSGGKVNQNDNDSFGFHLGLGLHASHLVEVVVYPMAEPGDGVDVVLR
jgi:hypothetical protein